ncbi:universal stress protein [Microtetraspora sp. NBRC 16547]|uniref:universal stress protein n=1 Tax=Microtetraspora sp. NBRC 16547 TaxID=3030993 RepID=UPI0024A441AC|nr:universal stress protein [Microtetraspora sp. NBRC 16547]GLW98581.1 universal stress protein [Microtetraspora sp. NBRC 16547]
MRADESQRPVVVGYDGSACSEWALRLAVREAQLRYAPLVVTHAWQWPFAVKPSDPSVIETVRHTAEFVIGKGVTLAATLAPHLEVRARLERGSAASVLLTEAAAEELIVLGTRGTGGFERLRVGATAAQVAGHAPCPVILVSGPIPEAGRVVVGVDDSPQSGRVLGFALEEASLRRSDVLAVHAWTEGDQPSREAAARFQRIVAPWCEKYPQVQVFTSFAEWPAEEALLTVSGDAALLVIGNRAHREPARVTLGLVTQSVLHDALCPVAVIPQS